MTPKAAMRALLWLGEKHLAGDEWSEEDLARFVEARNVSIMMARLTMNLKPHHYAYFPGQSYQEMLEAPE